MNVRSADRKGKGRKKRKTARSDEHDDRRNTESPRGQLAELRPGSGPGSEAGSAGYVASSPDAAAAGYWPAGASSMSGRGAPSSDSGGL